MMTGARDDPNASVGPLALLRTATLAFWVMAGRLLGRHVRIPELRLEERSERSWSSCRP